ncbi:MAG: DUF1801 domain-containing protein [Planctomycetales bacterium]|nr:DUF1801 domain-containing protein [Planctomycetales bacterium]
MRQKIPLSKKQAIVKQQGSVSLLVDDFVAGLAGWKKEVAEELRATVLAASRELTEEVKWGWPCYTVGGRNVCSLMAMKDTVNFVLFLGAELEDPSGLIEGTGKSMRHVKLRSPADIDKAKFRKFIQESIRLVKD